MVTVEIVRNILETANVEYTENHDVTVVGETEIVVRNGMAIIEGLELETVGAIRYWMRNLITVENVCGLLERMEMGYTVTENTVRSNGYNIIVRNNNVVVNGNGTRECVLGSIPELCYWLEA